MPRISGGRSVSRVMVRRSWLIEAGDSRKVFCETSTGIVGLSQVYARGHLSA